MNTTKIGIYKITNKINGKCYIGQSQNIDKRWRKHQKAYLNNNNRAYYYPLYKDFRKFGIENFKFEIIEICKKEDLDKKEVYWINYYDTYHKGYNQTIGGDSRKREPDKRVFDIIRDLKNTSLTFEDISKNRQISIGMVAGINSGQNWYFEDQSYPIRSKTLKSKHVNKCIKCGEKVYSKNSLCVHCYHEKQAKNIPSKEELLNLILTFPLTQIGEMYSVSSKAVERWCKKYDLPSRYNDIKMLRETLNIEEWNGKSNAQKMKQVNQYDLDGNLICKHTSLKKAAQTILKTDESKDNIRTITYHISRCCHHYKETAYGFSWEFV